MSSIAVRRANKRVCPLQPNGLLSRGTSGILAQMGGLPHLSAQCPRPGIGLLHLRSRCAPGGSQGLRQGYLQIELLVIPRWSLRQRSQ